MSIPDFWMESNFFADEELGGTREDKFTAVDFDFATVLSSPFLLLYPLRHCGVAYQTGILSAASRAEMADVEQMKKMISPITCETFFG